MSEKRALATSRPNVSQRRHLKNTSPRLIKATNCDPRDEFRLPTVPTDLVRDPTLRVGHAEGVV